MFEIERAAKNHLKILMRLTNFVLVQLLLPAAWHLRRRWMAVLLTAIPSGKVGRPVVYNTTVKDVVKMVRNSCRTGIAKVTMVESIRHLFYSEKCVQHVLLPLLKIGFLTCRATKGFERVSSQVRQLQIMRSKYRSVNFFLSKVSNRIGKQRHQ